MKLDPNPTFLLTGTFTGAEINLMLEGLSRSLWGMERLHPDDVMPRAEDAVAISHRLIASLKQLAE